MEISDEDYSDLYSDEDDEDEDEYEEYFGDWGNYDMW